MPKKKSEALPEPIGEIFKSVSHEEDQIREKRSASLSSNEKEVFKKTLRAGGIEGINKFSSDNEAMGTNTEIIKRALIEAVDSFNFKDAALGISDAQRKRELVGMYRAIVDLENWVWLLSPESRTKLDLTLRYHSKHSFCGADDGPYRDVCRELEEDLNSWAMSLRDYISKSGTPKGGRPRSGQVRVNLIQEIGRIFDLAAIKEFQTGYGFEAVLRTNPKLSKELGDRRIKFASTFCKGITRKDDGLSLLPTSFCTETLHLPCGFSENGKPIRAILGDTWHPPTDAQISGGILGLF